MNEPVGRRGSLSPARLRRMALLTARTAASWPMSRLCSSSSMRRSFLLSASVSLTTGMPVHMLTISAISSSPMLARMPSSLVFHWSSSSSFLWLSLRSLSRRLAAFSNSWASMAASFSLRTRGDLLFELAVAGRRRHGADAHAAGGLVDEVDGLVRQEAVADVAVGQLGAPS